MHAPPTSNLLKVALESRKTQSRRAASRQSSYSGSAANSRAGSRIGSRQATDDEGGADDELISESGWSTTDSIDGGLAGAEDNPHFSWEDELNNRIESILDRKRSSAQGREQDYATYVHILRSRFSQAEIEEKSSDLLEAFLRSVRDEMSEKEALNALKAISITILTDPSQAPFDLVHAPLRASISSSISRNIKEEALYTLGIATYFGGASDTDLDTVTTYLLTIIESDGTAANAFDDPDVVAAALDSFALLTTASSDLSETSQDFVAALAEQLESADPRVQIAAGEGIALLYEKSYTEVEGDEDPDRNPDTNDPLPYKKRYTPYRQQPALLTTLTSLSKVSAKNLSKSARKSLHTNFADIAQSVEQPTLGPRYSTALDPDGRYYGSRMSVKMGKGKTMRIDRWWKLVRLKAVTRVVQGGLVEHVEGNEAVGTALQEEGWEFV